MADVKQVTPETVHAGFPDHTLPTIYADGVLNLAPSQQVMKFYLSRAEPNFDGVSGYRFVPVAQVVMSTAAFIHTALFFERALQGLVEAKILKQEELDALRKKPEAV